MDINERTVAELPRESFHETLLRATPRFWVTPALIALNLAYFIAAVARGVSPVEPEMLQVLELGANFGPLTFEGEWFRLLSSTFVHIGFLHLALNMWCLWSLGSVAERMFGNVTFLILYLSSGIGGSLASLLWHPEIVSAGASGAVFGVAGGLVSFLYAGRIRAPQQVVSLYLSSLAIFVGFSLLFGFLWPGIDNAGHLGGLLVGLALGALLHRPLPPGRRRTWRFLAVPVAALIFFAAARFARVNGADDPKLLAAKATQLEAEGNREAAVSELERALSLDPELTEGYLQLGVLLVADQRFDDAAAAFEKAVALSPKSAEIRSALGFAYLRAERYPEAIATFEKATELDPVLYEPQRNLAIALRYAGRWEEAHEAFRIARQMEPSDLSLYLESSALFLESDRLDEAVAVLEEARTWNPASAKVESQMGLVRLKRGEAGLAVEALQKAAELEPGEAEHHNRLALALARAGEGERALQSIEKALELRPDAHHLFDSLGTVRLSRGEAAEAVDAYRRAAKIAPEEAIYHYNLSLALDQKGARREAEAEKDQAFRIDPDLSPPADGTPII